MRFNPHLHGIFLEGGFKTNARLFPALELLVQLLQHLPKPRVHPVRRFGLYSSRSRGTWIGKPWLLAKIYEVDALRCCRCGSPMKMLAVITDPPEVRRILLHLIKTGVALPGLDASSLN